MPILRVFIKKDGNFGRLSGKEFSVLIDIDPCWIRTPLAINEVAPVHRIDDSDDRIMSLVPLVPRTAVSDYRIPEKLGSS